MSLIQLQDAYLAFGHIPLLEQVNLSVERRERLCLVGRNGTGKSTLFRVLCGEEALDSGHLRMQDGVQIAKLAQDVPIDDDRTLFEVVAGGLGSHAELLTEWHQSSQTLATANDQQMARFSRLQTRMENEGVWDGSARVDKTLSQLKLPPEARLCDCSGGMRRRAMLGRAMVNEPDVLLLDEPTNHLDIESIDALEKAVREYTGTVIFITHDRAFIDALATRIIELDRGQLASFPGNYQSYLTRKAAMLEEEVAQQRRFDKELAQEEVWIRQGIKARRTRNEGRVRRLEALRAERAARLERQGSARLSLGATERSGKLVVETENLSFGHDDQLLIKDLTTTIVRGDRVGIVGANGSGKSTLIKLLLGDLVPTSGMIKRGTKLDIAYFDQERMQLDPKVSVRDCVADGADHVTINGQSRHVISHLGDFLFPPARVHSPVSTLSGGERNRLLLARLFTQPANLLIMDEPTNDLDIETLELLEELLSQYQGTLLLVSHDRRFLDACVTSTLILSGDGRIEEHVGGYSDWQHYLRQQVTESDQAKTKSSRSGQSKRRSAQGSTLSFEETHELKKLPAQIEALDQTLTALTEKVADPTFYQQDEAVVAKDLQQLADLEKTLSEAYGRWEALEQRQGKAG